MRRRLRTHKNDNPFHVILPRPDRCVVMASSFFHVDGPKLSSPLVKVIVLLRYNLLRVCRRTTDVGFQVRCGRCFGGLVVLVFGTFGTIKSTNWKKVEKYT